MKILWASVRQSFNIIDAEKMNRNRRAEKDRVIHELNRGYKKGGHVKSMGKAKRGGGIAKR